MFLNQINKPATGVKTPAQLPLILGRKNIQIVPTRYGFLFLLMLLAVLLGSINYGNNPGYLITFLMGSMVSVSLLHTYKNLADITIVSCWARPVFAGENARFEFIVRGAGTGGTGIGFAFDKEKEILRNIETGRDNRVDVHAPASTRGRLTPGPLLIFSNYPLGLFHARSRLYIDLSCLVYPKPLAQVANSISEIFSAQGENGNYGSGVDDFQGLRGYVPGDPLQRISWRASSRGQGLFTKEFAGQHGSAVFLDWNRLTASGRERKLSILCAMVLEAQQTQIKYGLKLPGKTIEPDNGEVHRNRCLKALALFPLK